VNIITLIGHAGANKNQSLRPAVPSALNLASKPALAAEIDSCAKPRRFCDFPGF
jgi:hypothetical protein